VSRGDSAGALKAAAEALEEAPRFVAPMVLAAALDESAGRRDEAIDTYRRILELDANHVVALNNLAYALAVHRKAPAEGLPFARRAVAAAPNSPTVIDTLAWIQYLLGDHAAAAKLVQEVMKSNTLNPDVRLHAAIILAAAGQRPQAQTQLAIALKLRPSLAQSDEVRQLQAKLAK